MTLALVVVVAGVGAPPGLAQVGNHDADPAEPRSESAMEERVMVLKSEAHRLIAENELDRGWAVLDELIALDVAHAPASGRTVGKGYVEIASTLLPTGDHARLEQVFIRGIQILQGSRDTSLGDLLVALYNLGILHAQQGNDPDWTRAIASIAAVAESYDGVVDVKAAEVMLAVAGVYLRAKMPNAVAVLLRQVDRYLHQQDESGMKRVQVLVGYLSVHLDGDPHEQARAVLEETRELVEREPTDPLTVVVALASMGIVAAEENDLRSAEYAFDRARNIAETSGFQEESGLTGILYQGLASIYLRTNRREKYPDAMRYYENYLKILEQEGAGMTSEHALTLNQMAQLADRMNDTDKARRLFKAAIRGLGEAADTDPQEFALSLRDLGRFLSAQVGADEELMSEAIVAFERALEVRRSMPEAMSGELADAHSDLALAYFRVEDFRRASQTYWRAIGLRIEAAGRGVAHSPRPADAESRH